jgi:hypothetical protein
MKLRHWITAIVLFLLTAAAIAGLVWTRQRRGASDGATPLPAIQNAGNRSQGAAPSGLVVATPVQTGRRIGRVEET